MIFSNRQPNLTPVCVDLDLQPTLWKMKSFRYLAWLSSICLLIAFVTSSAGAATNEQSKSINWTFPYEKFPDQTFTPPVTLPKGIVFTLPMKMTGTESLKIINRADGSEVFSTTFSRPGRIAGRARVKLLAGNYEVEELLTSLYLPRLIC